MVSGLAADAVRSFLLVHGLGEHVRFVAARTGADRGVLPPSPDLITTAVRERALAVCVVVASTSTDLAAARAAGIAAVRHRGPPAADGEPPGWFEALSAVGRRYGREHGSP